MRCTMDRRDILHADLRSELHSVRNASGAVHHAPHVMRRTACLNDFNSQKFKLRVSNPRFPDMICTAIHRKSSTSSRKCIPSLALKGVRLKGYRGVNHLRRPFFVPGTPSDHQKQPKSGLKVTQKRPQRVVPLYLYPFKGQ